MRTALLEHRKSTTFRVLAVNTIDVYSELFGQPGDL